MTVQEAEIVRNYFSTLEIELREIILQTPIYVREQELEGYLDLTMIAFCELLIERMEALAEAGEYEKALAIKRFIRARLKDYEEQCMNRKLTP